MKNILFSPPDITETEIQEVAEAMRSGWITTGKRTKEFEKMIAEYIGTHTVAALNSATSAMELTLRMLGVGPGDEVITSAYTYTASASVIHHVGAKIVFVDVARDSFEMDYDQLSHAITERTKVIIPVDLGGRMCDYHKIFEIVNQKRALFHPSNKIQECIGRIVIMADSAHGFGASQLVDKKWLRSGQVADFTCFSFHAVKNLTTAEGGAVTWRPVNGIEDDWIYRQFMLLSLHGQSKDAFSKNQLGSWEYDILMPAYKCNMTDIQAAIGLRQLERYEQMLKRRKEVIRKYDAAFRPFGTQPLIHEDETSCSSGHLYLLRIAGFTESQRNETIRKMAELGVATNVHYKPLPMMTAYKDLGFSIDDYPNSYAQYRNEMTLPLHTCLSDEDVDWVIECMTKILKERRVSGLETSNVG